MKHVTIGEMGPSDYGFWEEKTIAKYELSHMRSRTLLFRVTLIELVFILLMIMFVLMNVYLWRAKSEDVKALDA